MVDGAWQYEAKLKQMVSAQLRAGLAGLQRTATTYWLLMAGGSDQPLPELAQQQLRLWLHQQIRLLRPDDLAPGLRSAMVEGLQIGAQDAGAPPDLRLRVSRELNEAAGRIDSTIRDALVAARHDARHAPLRTYGDFLTILGKIGVAANRAEATAVWAAHRALNDGVRAAAGDGIPNPLVWVPERDACLTCLAYAGRVILPGDMFPVGLTFGDSSSVRVPIPGPPAHPFCRCALELLPVGGGGADDSFVLSMVRAAQREVLLGQVLASEPAQLRAADRLLRAAVPLLVPKTVVQRARERVTRG